VDSATQYHICNRPTILPIMYQMNLVHATPFYWLKFHLTAKLPSMFRSSYQHLSFTFSKQNQVSIPHILYMHYMSHPSYPPWFHQSKLSCEGTYHEFPHYAVFSVLLLLPLLRPKYLRQHPFSNTLGLLPFVRDQASHPCTTTGTRRLMHL